MWLDRAEKVKNIYLFIVQFRRKSIEKLFLCVVWVLAFSGCASADDISIFSHPRIKSHNLDNETKILLAKKYPGEQPLLAIDLPVSKCRKLINNAVLIGIHDLGGENDMLLWVENGHGVVINDMADPDFLVRQIEKNISGFPREESDIDCVYNLMTLKFFPEQPGYIGGDKDLFKDLSDSGIQGWLYSEEKEPAVFRRFAGEKPKLNYDEKNNKWSVSFFVIRCDGGVDKVFASGLIKPFKINEIKKEEIKKKGTFSCDGWVG